MPDKKENDESGYVFGKFEINPGRYTIVPEATPEKIVVDYTTKEKRVIPGRPRFTILVPKTLLVDLDSPEFDDQPDENKQLAREKFEKMGAVEVTPELERIRFQRKQATEEADKAFKRAQDAENLVINKQHTKRKKEIQIKSIGTL